MNRVLSAAKSAGLYLHSIESIQLKLKKRAFLVALAWLWPTPHPNCHGGAAGERGDWGSAAGRPKEEPGGRFRVCSGVLFYLMSN